MDSYDYLFKVVIIGDTNVGKTSLLNRFCNKTFTEKLSTTVGVDFLVCDIDIGTEEEVKSKVKLQLWDTAGEEKYQSITSIYYRNADAVILVFDVTRPETFEHTSDWLSNVYDRCGRDIYCLLVGNKCDLEQKVDYSDIEDFAYLHNLHFVETSARSSSNVEETFYKLASHLLEERNQLLSLGSLDSGPSSLWLHLQEAKSKQTGYCCSYI